MKTLLLLVCISIYPVMQGLSQPSNDSKRYVKVPAGYLMVLKQGDSLFDELTKFAKEEKIPSANFTGMGFVNITFGYFDFKTKKYSPGYFKAVELTSMNGSIAWKGDSISIHAHGTVADKSFQVFGGHILSANVDTGSAEIVIIVHDRAFQRKKDESIGADILNLSTY